jgi:hypothetical protein
MTATRREVSAMVGACVLALGSFGPMSGCGDVVTPTPGGATGENPNGASGTGTSGAEAGDTGGGSAGATTGAGTSGGAADASGSRGNFGLVIIETNVPGQLSASASFSTNVSPASPSPPCPTQTIDGCIISTCGPLMAPASAAVVSAGILTIRGGPSPLVLMPGQNGLYEGSETETSMAPLAGGVLQVSTSGGVVPAFNADVTIPQLITVTSPAALANLNLTTENGLVPVTIVRSEGWTVAWTGGAGVVDIEINQQISSSASVVAWCSFSPTAGSGVISPAVLAFFAPTDANGFPTTLVNTEASADVEVTLSQNWDVSVVALGPIGPSAPVVIQ